LQTKKYVYALLLHFSLLFAEIDYGLTNTNYTVSQGSVFPHDDTTYLYNYNRLRFRGNYTQEHLFATFIADGVSYLGHSYLQSSSFSFVKLQKSDTPFKTQTDFYTYGEGSFYAKVYRLYGGYEDEQNRLSVGLQNITMGVGRIWTPTNLFNPRNAYAFEPDEVFGVAALTYTRYLSDTSRLMLVTSQKADHSFKYALSYKAFVRAADIAINLISSTVTKMVGYEIEANLADSGIEIRSEGAYIKSKLKNSLTSTENEEFFQGIIGADYGFANGVTLVTEALYSSKTFSYESILLNYDAQTAPNLRYSHFYLAVTLAYDINMFLNTSLLYIESFNTHHSRFISPLLTYTLNDFNKFTLGAMLQYGADESEFGAFSNRYYFNYVLSF